MTDEPRDQRVTGGGASRPTSRRQSDALASANRTRHGGVRESAAPSPRRRRAMVAAAGVASIAVLLLLLGPSSFRTWMSQRSQTATLETKIDTLDTANDALEQRAKELRQSDTIKSMARKNYGMVPKGAKAYAITPSASDHGALGSTWPFAELARTETGVTTTTTP